VVKAVENVTFSLNAGETLGLVGESGSGKSMTCLSLMRLVPEPAGKIVRGQVFLQGEDLLKKTKKEMEKIRGKKISMILQDPMTALNPVFTVGEQVTEAIALHQRLKGIQLAEKAKQVLRLVRIASPEARFRNYPHELSGGMRQRVVGAMALSCEPDILIADEPTTSLDVTIQAQYLQLLKELQEQSGMAMIFVTHDFGIVALMCSNVAVMYAGTILEMADTRELYNNPLHPYTVALMQAVPRADKRIERLESIEGQPPPLHRLPQGCSFNPRCTSRCKNCSEEEFPPAIEVSPNHWVKCWLYV
jgi:oligopeptide/dipeptide ABC transporter ATP-binding protein